MGRVGLFLLLLLSASNTLALDENIEVPFAFEKGHIIVQARIKNDVPVEVAIATGAKYSSIDTALTEKYKLQRGYAGEPPVTGHNDRIYFFSVVPDVRIGDLKATSLTMRLGSTAKISKDLGREIFGVIGADFFKARIVQFDFDRKVLTFLARSNVKGATVATPDLCTLRIAVTTNLYDNSVLPVVNGVEFDGRKVSTLFDTGAVVVTALSSSTAKKVGLKEPSQKGVVGTGKVGTLRIGSCQLDNVRTLIASKDSELERSLGDSNAVVGIGVLQNFVVTFDYKNKLIMLERK